MKYLLINAALRQQRGLMRRNSRLCELIYARYHPFLRNSIVEDLITRKKFPKKKC